MTALDSMSPPSNSEKGTSPPAEIRPLDAVELTSTCAVSLRDERSYSYGKLLELALLFSDELEAHAVTRDSEVLVLCQDRFLFLLTLLALLNKGAVAVLPASHSSPLCQQLKENLLTITDEEARSQFPSIHVRRWLDEHIDRKCTSHRTLRPWQPNQTLAILYTSGSQGEPVRWKKQLRQLWSEVLVHHQRLAFGPETRVLATVPPGHIYGLLFGVLLPLSAGAISMSDGVTVGSSWLSVLERFESDWLITVPAHLEGIVSELEQDAHKRKEPRRLPQVIVSGAELRPRLAERAQAVGFQVEDILGSTETGGLASRLPAQSSAYRAFAGVEWSVQNGHLVVRSPFLRDPAEAHETSDCVRPLDPWTFEHLGRDDGTVKVGGKRVQLRELEKACLELPGVHDVRAFVRSVDALRGTDIFLLVIAPGYTAELLRAELRQRIDPIAMPRQIRIIERLPLDDRGKVPLTRALEALDSNRNRPVVTLHLEEPTTGNPHLPEENRRVQFSVPVNSLLFAGHFPSEPLVPAASLIAELLLPAIERAWPHLGAPKRLERLQLEVPILPGTQGQLKLVRRDQRIDFSVEQHEQRLARGSLYF